MHGHEYLDALLHPVHVPASAGYRVSFGFSSGSASQPHGGRSITNLVRRRDWPHAGKRMTAAMDGRPLARNGAGAAQSIFLWRRKRLISKQSEL